jgi:hypothetical protein
VHDVVTVRALDGLRLWLRFADGSEGTVDLAGKVRFVGVLRTLEDPAIFRRASVNRDTGTVEWPGGADLDPDALYAWAHGTSPEAMLGIEPPS